MKQLKRKKKDEFIYFFLVSIVLYRILNPRILLFIQYDGDRLHRVSFRFIKGFQYPTDILVW